MDTNCIACSAVSVAFPFQVDYEDMMVSFSQRANSIALRQPNGYQVIPTNVSFVSLLEPNVEEPVYWRVPGMTGDMVGCSVFGILTVCH